MAQAHVPKKAGKRGKAKSSGTLRAKSKTKPKQVIKPAAARASTKARGNRRHKMSETKAGKHQRAATSHSASQPVQEVPPRGSLSRPLPLEPAPRLLRDSKNTTGALVILEKGIKQLYLKDFKKARSEFKSLIETFSAESEIIAKARSYIQICDREEAAHRRPAITNDQLYTLGVMEHNRGNFEGAISHFKQSLEKNRNAEHIYYSLAASLSQKGDAPEAIQTLRRAIEMNEDNRIYAKNDQDFASLHSNRDFADLVGISPTGVPGNSTQP
jgi:tetratricopeptide (TPR) repeat protein